MPAIGSEGEGLWCRRSAAKAKTKYSRAARVPLLRSIQCLKAIRIELGLTNPIRFGLT